MVLFTNVEYLLRFRHTHKSNQSIYRITKYNAHKGNNILRWQYSQETTSRTQLTVCLNGKSRVQSELLNILIIIYQLPKKNSVQLLIAIYLITISAKSRQSALWSIFTHLMQSQKMFVSYEKPQFSVFNSIIINLKIRV